MSSCRHSSVALKRDLPPIFRTTVLDTTKQNTADKSYLFSTMTVTVCFSSFLTNAENNVGDNKCPTLLLPLSPSLPEESVCDLGPITEIGGKPFFCQVGVWVPTGGMNTLELWHCSINTVETSVTAAHFW